MQEQRSMIRKQGSWEIGEVDQVKIGSVVEDGEGGAFDFARGEQPGVCGGQGGVVVARVGDEFETAFAGQSPQKGGEGGAVESPCGEDAERAIGGLEAVFLHEAVEAGGEQQPEEADLGAAGVARMLHAGSKGLRMARMPQERAARRTGHSTRGNMCVCLWVSMWVRLTPRD